MVSFEGFSPSDFDAFEKEKWSSHAFNRERLEVKLKLTALGRELAPGIERRLPGQEMGLTEERPSIFNQHQVRDLTLFFLRDQHERRFLDGILDRAKSIADNLQDPAPHHKHIILGARIHHEGLEMGLCLHQDAWVDWKNVVQRCREYWELSKLSELLAYLPETIRFGQGERLSPDAPPSRGVNAEKVLDGFAKGGPWTVFGQALERTEPVLSSATLVERAIGLFEILAPLHSFLSWSRDNDSHNLREVLKEQREKAKLPVFSLKPGDRVRITKGLAAGRTGVVDALGKKGVVWVRLGTMVITLRQEELGKP